MNTSNFRIPADIQPLTERVVFDPERHLQLEDPGEVWTLADFGYPDPVVAAAPFRLAVTAPFRVLSDAGVRALREAIAGLQPYRRGSERIASFIRGAVFYSPFIRALCQSPEVTAHMARLSGRAVIPHPMALYQGHINLKPENAQQDVDKWHTDTIALDYVLMVTDPHTTVGGHFEYIRATKQQAIRAIIRDEAPARTVQVAFPAAGYAVLQQGNLVVHRGAAVESGERQSLVHSYIPADGLFADPSRLADCKPVDDPRYLYTEWARYKAQLAQMKLAQLLATLPYTEDRNHICTALRQAIRDVDEALLEISDTSEGRLMHFGQDALTDQL